MADFAQILIKATDQTKGAFDSAARNMRGLEAGASRLKGLMGGIGIGAGLSAAGFAAFAKHGIDAADALNDMSQRLGVSVKDLASFKLAAEQSGTSLEGVGTGIARLTRSIGEAEGGNKKLAGALGELGINARDPKEAFFQLADAVKRIDDPSKRAALLSQVLGKSYQDLVPLLAQGSDELRRSAQASESFADAMARLAPDADKFNDQLAQLKIEAAGVSGVLLERLVPSLTDTSARVRELLDSDHGIQALVRAFAGIGKLPWDAVFGDVKIASTAAERLKEMRSELAEFERVKSDAKGTILDRLFGTPAELDSQITVLKNQIIAMEKFGDKIYPQKKSASPVSPGVIDTSAATQKTSRAKTQTDPLASLLSSTDIGKTKEYENLMGLLEARFKNGRIGAEQFSQALAELNKRFSREMIDPLGSGSFHTTSKETAAFIREQQDAINGLNSEMAQDGVQSAQAFDSALQALISDTTIAKTAALQEQVAILDKALFDGAIGAEQHAEAMKKLTEGLPEKLKETNDFAKDLGLTFASAFEKAVVGGEKFSDVLKGLAQDIAQMLIRQNVTTPIANAVGGINWGAIISAAFATGGVMTSNGPMPLHSYAGGGVASTPQLALFGEGSMKEAFVPLPDGKRIPVAMKNGGGPTVINLNISTPDANSFRASSGQIAAQMTRALQRGRRFT